MLLLPGLKKWFICACLHCFSLLIVLLESMMQCAVLLFCCVFMIADCPLSKKQASSARFQSFLCTLYLLCYCVYWCLLSDDDWLCLTTKTNITGHSALCTIWLSAPVLAYIPVDFWHWLYALPQLLNARMGEWHHSGWLICGNHCTCSCGLVRLLLSSSDNLGSEESDHINVLAGQAMSKHPR
jgi:hypothetical protein